MDYGDFIIVWSLLSKIFEMIITHEGKVYETVITKPIMEGDLYYDCMVHKIRKCQSYICFDPWSLKLELKEENMSVEGKKDWQIDM